ncbi:MAG: tRNA dimethylallyltransferase [Candidatus Amesbacteria bacterium GW2011_GWA1_48_9]|uniref:tRNA dimethylallyltransferase n=3 Tax=Candidatus Amesiibacteriota TaxID=1752730 RepID=A0A0G1V0R3_9BACT|nr:MAG: tRNA dimethylallyltransferase [Candidatus Amesbacteria bacterium GW2011_GWA1_48_9]
MISTKVLIICGPTATGKTRFGLQMAKKFKGEIVSADSRQVYVGMDIVTGKDLPSNLKSQISNLKWRDRNLGFYEIGGIKVWLYDVVSPNEPFNVAFWKECADIVIADIRSRDSLPVVVGGTGLYLKSLTHSLSQISVPPHQILRTQLAAKSAKYLFNYLNKLDPNRASRLNSSDRANPRRLIRAIEIALSSNQPPPSLLAKTRAEGENLREGRGVSYLTIGLTAPRAELYRRVDLRVDDRLRQGAEAECQRLVSKYGWDLPSFTASGYRALRSSEPKTIWSNLEHAYIRRQLTWFTHKPDVRWFDITASRWQSRAQELISSWYNDLNTRP